MYTGDAFSLSVNSVFLTYLYILVSFRRRNNVNQLLLYLQCIHITLISEMNSCLSEFFGFCGLHLVSSTIRLSCYKSPTVLLDMHHLTCGISCLLHSDVTISKFRFSIDFDSIFSPKWRFRFNSILLTPTLNHSRQNSVTTDAGRSSSKRFIAFTKPAGVC